MKFEIDADDWLLAAVADDLDRASVAPPRVIMPLARTKQLPPDHPRHHLPDEKGFRCGCAQEDLDWVIWLIQSGRGWGKTDVGSHWIAHQAATNPGSEWAVFAPTFRDVRKTCFEGPTGLVKTFRDGELLQYRRNELQVTLTNGATIFGYSAAEPDRARGSNLWGAWCVARGEMVTTVQGLIPIEQVRPGERVWTRKGWRRVLARTMTASRVPVVKVNVGNGSAVRLTPTHRVWTKQRGWVEARALHVGDKISTWSLNQVHPHGSNGKTFAGIDVVVDQDTTLTERDASCMLPFGSDNMGVPYPQDTLSTIGITTSSTTIPITYSCLQGPSILDTTTSRILVGQSRRRHRNEVRNPSHRGPVGLPVSEDVRYAPSYTCLRGNDPCTARQSAGWPHSSQIDETAESSRYLPANANGVARSSSPATAAPCIALAHADSTPAMRPNAHGLGRVWEPPAAYTVATHSPPRMDVSSFVRTPVESVTYVASVESNGLADVFDLKVEDAPEFVAGGILVHNCDELGSWQYEETWHEGLVPALRKGERPRIVVTTTPRPTPLIRNLVGRGDGTVHVTRGSTWENAANLSAVALAELKRRYEGTRLGRQELEGELLDDIEGALWKRSDIDAARITKAQLPHLTKVVVAIDPAVTSSEGSDETGIIVAAEGGSHGYVLADLSMRGTPHACMVVVAKAFEDFECDTVIGEVNNGGDYIGSLLRTVAPTIPYRTVHASRGKAIRAQPVASLYEQHKVHHVGMLGELEDQLTNWLPDSGESPDRLDALVWALTDLRGLFTGLWTEAYGVITCEKCKHPFMTSTNPLRCPRCQHPHGTGTQPGAVAA